MLDLTHLDKFQLAQLAVKELRDWVICIRAKQITLGSCVILLKRAEPSFGGLTSREAIELTEAARWFESVTIAAFGAEKFNYVAAMMKDPFVHFHALPRYSKPKEMFGQTWLDKDWPRAVSLSDTTTPVEVLDQLARTLRESG